MKKYIKRVMSLALTFMLLITTAAVAFADEIEDKAEVYSNDGNTVKISGEIKWYDGDNKDLLRPDSVKINLLGNNEILESKEITEKDEWKYSFSNLDVHDKYGESIKYKIEEDMDSEEYKSEISGYDILSSTESERLDFTVKIIWEDDDNANKLRPTSIKVILTENDKNTSNKVSIEADSNWKYDFRLPKDKDIKYGVIIDGYPSGYELKDKDVSSDGVTITLKDTTNVVENPQNKFSVKYDNNSGKGTVSDNKSPYNKDDEVTVLTKGEISKDDYKFVNWNTQSDGKGKTYKEGEKFKITEDTTLYAQWELLKFEVKYDSNFGDGSVKDDKSPYNKDSEVTVLGKGNLTRTNYKFTGWNTKSDGKGKSYKEGEKFEITEDTTLYAQWERTSLYTSSRTGSGSSSSSSSSLPKTGMANVLGFTVAGIGLVGLGTSILLKKKDKK